MTTCIDCGKDATGVRCRPCSTRHRHYLAAVLLRPDDEALLGMRDREKLSYASIGRRLGVSRPAVQVRLARARARQKRLQETT